MKIIFLLLFSSVASAEYLLGYGVGAYMGRHQLQGEIVSDDSKHHTLGFLSYTRDEGMRDIRQLGLAYQYAFPTREYDQIRWVPLLAGGFVTYTDNINYNVEAPKKYKDPDYYDMTSIRFGLRFSSQIILVRKNQKTIRFSIDGSLLERAIINFSNNPDQLDIFPAYWSLGFSLRFELPEFL